MKLLLVDDDCDQVDLLTYAFQRHGYSVATAGDGRQALARRQSDQPDLVVLDVNLTQVTGLEVCRQTRAGSNMPWATPTSPVPSCSRRTSATSAASWISTTPAQAACVPSAASATSSRAARRYGPRPATIPNPRWNPQSIP